MTELKAHKLKERYVLMWLYIKKSVKSITRNNQKCGFQSGNIDKSNEKSGKKSLLIENGVRRKAIKNVFASTEKNTW